MRGGGGLGGSAAEVLEEGVAIEGLVADGGADSLLENLRGFLLLLGEEGLGGTGDLGLGVSC